MRDIRRVRRENDFGVRCDFDLTRAQPVVRDRNAAHFGIIFR
jgi:hypothetical protein